MQETNPSRLSCVPSISYSVFQACFREFWMTDLSILPIQGNIGPTKPNKPKLVKLLSINNIEGKRLKQTQAVYLASYQLVIAIFRLFIKKFGSAAYRSPARIRGRWCLATNPNKPNDAKTFVLSNMAEKSNKQTQRTYRSCYQLLAGMLDPILRKYGWRRGGSLSEIGRRAQGRFQLRWANPVANLSCRGASTGEERAFSSKFSVVSEMVDGKP